MKKILKQTMKNTKIEYMEENKNLKFTEYIFNGIETIPKEYKYYYIPLKFNQGNNYEVSSNGLVAKKINRDHGWNCNIICNRKIDYDKKNFWRIKILHFTPDCDGVVIFIGIILDSVNINETNIYGSGCFFCCLTSTLWKSGANGNSCLEKEVGQLKAGDIIGILADLSRVSLSLQINNSKMKETYNNIPKNCSYFPCVMIVEENDAVELINDD